MAKDKMGACMSEWKDKHPKGRSDKKMSKKQAQKQAVAVCLQKTNESQRFSPSSHMKSAYAQSRRQCPKCGKSTDKSNFKMSNGKEVCTSCANAVKEALSMTFKQFLKEENDIRSIIRSMPMYSELIKNQQTKPQALALTRSFMQEFGNQPINRDIQSYIQDEFDDLYRNTLGRHGSQVGDWEGEAAYKQRDELEKQLGAASDKWEREMGTSAQTGEEIPQAKRDSHGKLRGGARVGLDMRNKVKQKRAAQDLLSFGNFKSDADRERLERKASMDAPSETTWSPEHGGPTDQNPTTKVNRAKKLAADVFQGLEPGMRIPREKSAELKQRLASELDMGKNGVNTYYYRMKKLFDNGEL